MPQDANAILQTLTCVSTSDGSGRSPYLWPVLLWIDDTTLADPNLLVGGSVPLLGGARVVVKDNMRPGDSASVPYPWNTLSNRFEDNLSMVRLVVAALLWEKHDTPDAAVWAGCQAFSSELRSAVAANLLSLNDQTSRDHTINAIKTQVTGAVTSAIANALSPTEKVEYALGRLTLDSAIGSDFAFMPSLASGDLTLSIAKNSAESYTVVGGVEVTTPFVDVCQAQVDAVNAANAQVDAINQTISNLQDQLSKAPPAQKSSIAAQIKNENNDLAVAQADLVAARAALKACRDRWKQIADTIRSVSVVSTQEFG